MKTSTLTPLWNTLHDLLAVLREMGCPHVVIGGIASSLIGQVRTTRDIDVSILLQQEQWEQLLAHAQRYHFVPRITDVLKFAARRRVILLQHHESQVMVDLSFAALPFEEEVFARRQLVTIDTLTIPLPTPEDLVIMKAVAHRPQDLVDIEQIIDIHRDRLDRARIRHWVKQFAAVLEMPELYRDLDRLLKQSQLQKRKRTPTRARTKN